MAATKKVIIEISIKTKKQLLALAKVDQRKVRPLLKPFIEKLLINACRKTQPSKDVDSSHNL